MIADEIDADDFESYALASNKIYRGCQRRLPSYQEFNREFQYISVDPYGDSQTFKSALYLIFRLMFSKAYQHVLWLEFAEHSKPEMDQCVAVPFEDHFRDNPGVCLRATILDTQGADVRTGSFCGQESSRS